MQLIRERQHTTTFDASLIWRFVYMYRAQLSSTQRRSAELQPPRHVPLFRPANPPSRIPYSQLRQPLRTPRRPLHPACYPPGKHQGRVMWIRCCLLARFEVHLGLTTPTLEHLCSVTTTRWPTIAALLTTVDIPSSRPSHRLTIMGYVTSCVSSGPHKFR